MPRQSHRRQYKFGPTEYLTTEQINTLETPQAILISRDIITDMSNLVAKVLADRTYGKLLSRRRSGEQLTEDQEDYIVFTKELTKIIMKDISTHPSQLYIKAFLATLMKKYEEYYSRLSELYQNREYLDWSN